MKKLDYITVLRAVAILFVLVIHVKQQTIGVEHLHPYLISLLDNGALGVELFYILSAFTLFHSFSYRSTIEKTPVKNYFIRRFFRIAPLYYLAIIYYLWQDGTGPRFWLGDEKYISVANIISNFTFSQGFNPYWINSLVPGGWSIAIEVLFYSCLPLLFSKIKNIQHAFNFVLITLGIRFIFLVFFTKHILISDQRLWHEYLFLYFPNQLPIFSLGIVLYFLIYDNTRINLTHKSFLLMSIIIILGCTIQQDLIIPLLFIFGVAFLLLAIAFHKYHPHIFFNRLFLYIGKISYTIYLTHWASIYFLNRYGIMNLFATNTESLAIMNFVFNYTMVLTITVIFSTGLYYAVELPMQKFGGRLIRKFSTPTL